MRVFAFEVNSGQFRKVAEIGGFRVIFPYMLLVIAIDPLPSVCFLHFDLKIFKRLAIIVLASATNVDNIHGIIKYE
jgi:hypothetical protein